MILMLLLHGLLLLHSRWWPLTLLNKPKLLLTVRSLLQMLKIRDVMIEMAV